MLWYRIEVINFLRDFMLFIISLQKMYILIFDNQRYYWYSWLFTKIPIYNLKT